MSVQPQFHLALIRQKYNAAGGAERFVSRALGALQAGDVRVSLLTRRWEAVAGIAAVILNPFYVGSLWRDWSFARAVGRYLAAHPFDLVQSHERIPGVEIYRAGDGVHRVWLLRRQAIQSPWMRWATALNVYHHFVCKMERRMYQHPKFRHVICNSEMVSNEISSTFNILKKDISVIYNGIDLDRFSPALTVHRDEIRAAWRIPSHATLFLFVGSGFARKGLAAAIAALATQSDDAYLLVVGKDKHQARYQALSARLGLGVRVVFAGAQQQVAPFYGAADACVLPSLYDPFPNAGIEALASGVPLICSDACGVAELITEGENGYVTAPTDTLAIAAAMQRVAHHPHREQLRIAARQSVAGLSLAAMGAQLTQLYQRLLAESAPIS